MVQSGGGGDLGCSYGGIVATHGVKVAQREREREREGKSIVFSSYYHRDHVEMVLKCIEDSDLRRWSLPDIRAFNIGIDQWRSKLNCITNPYMYEQVWLLNLMPISFLFSLNIYFWIILYNHYFRLILRFGTSCLLLVEC